MILSIFENRRKFNALVQDLRKTGELNEQNLRKVKGARSGFNFSIFILLSLSVFLIFVSPMKFTGCITSYTIEVCGS